MSQSAHAGLCYTLTEDNYYVTGIESSLPARKVEPRGYLASVPKMARKLILWEGTAVSESEA